MSDFLDWQELASDMSDLLGEFQTVTLRKIGQGDYIDGAMTVANTDTYPKGCVLDSVRYGAGEVLQNGTLVQSSDRRLLLDTTGGKPALDDHVITISDGEFVIVNIKSVNPAVFAVMYDCQIRQ